MAIVFIIIMLIIFVSLIFIVVNMTTNKKQTALIIVDPQYDFCDNGTLAIRNAELIFPEINKLRQKFTFDNVIITQDWHPEHHISFASYHKKDPFTSTKCYLSYQKENDIVYHQDLWPDHCIAHSKGAEIHHKLIVANTDFIIQKGRFQNIDSYSGFGDMFNNYFEITSLEWYLKHNNIGHVIICGLATDYCVQSTALNAIKKGFKVTIIKSTICGTKPESTNEAIERMKNHGVFFVDTVDDLNNNLT